MTKNYIEFRVYLEPNAPANMVIDLAEYLQDMLIDETAINEGICTEDVSYEIHQTTEENK